MARSATTPKGAVTLTSFAALDEYVRAFADGKLNLLILIGRPGLQKSRVVREAVGSEACWIEGHATAFGMFCQLFRHRHGPVVVDDVDDLYADRQAVRLLKCLCETETVKRVAWYSDAGTLLREGIPRQFDTNSRVAIIANQWRTLSLNVAAIEDRGHVVVFEPTPLEVHRRTADWFWDQQVFDFVGEHLHLIDKPSMRQYVLARELKRAGMDWRGALLEWWNLSGAWLAVAQLKADPCYATEKERVRAFVAAGYGCRQTYFNHASRLRAPSNPPRIVLKNRPPDQAAPDPRLLAILRRRQGVVGNG